MDQEQTQTTLRDVIETNFEAAEAGTLPSVEEAAADQRARDEAGRFARKEAAPEVAPAAPVTQAAPVQAPVPQAPAGPVRPTTWKKEYLPIWDKLATGAPLNPQEAKKLAEYTQQRENEYKTGVSTYKAEAMQAKELQDAITPYIPELQANGLRPGPWIKSMAAAHYALYKGTPEIKLQVFQQLARQFNVPIQMLSQGGQQAPSLITDLLGQIDQLKQQVNGVTNWRHMQESADLMGEIQKVATDTARYPHFEAARETMAQLLERGLAPDLDTAYKQAEWMVPEIREMKLAEHSSVATRSNAVAAARARAVSPRSATPSGQVATAGTKDRRAMLSEAADALLGGAGV